MLKPGEFKIWRKVIKNGATLPKIQVVKGVMTEMPITSVEEKAPRRLEVKARSTLMIMMGISNKHQLKFNSIKDGKKLLEAVKKRFGENAATKKTQMNLLKQQYENFTAPSSEMLDQTFDRLQKLVSQLELLEEKLSQDDVNQKLLRSLSPEWNTHVVVWRNKVDLDTMSMDDLYNNLNVYEPEVKGMSSSSSSTQNMAFVSSSNNNTSSINGEVNTAQEVNTTHEVSIASTQVNAAYFKNIENLSDAIICLINPKWSATTATRGDILLGSAELQQIKTTRTRKAQEGVCLWKHLLPQLWCYVMVLVGDPQMDLQDQEMIVSECSRHMTENMSYLTNYEEIDERYIAFGGNSKRGKITGKCTIKTGTQSNGFAGTKASDSACQARKEIEQVKDYILLPLWTADPPFSQDPKSSNDDGSKPLSNDGKKVDEDPRNENEYNELPFDPNMPALKDVSIFNFSSDDEDNDAVADINNLDTTIQVSPIPTTRIHKDYPLDKVIEDLQSTTQTRKMSKNLEEHGFVSTI
nr:hypothetical protein [Tanacetum cinerariifolium]